MLIGRALDSGWDVHADPSVGSDCGQREAYQRSCSVRTADQLHAADEPPPARVGDLGLLGSPTKRSLLRLCREEPLANHPAPRHDALDSGVPSRRLRFVSR